MICCEDLDSFRGVARSLAFELRRGMSVAISGDLGVGKTTFCREVVHALSTDSFLGSPTFGIMHEYECSKAFLYHMDLYRVHSLREVQEAGVFDVLEENLVIIEWPGILGDLVEFCIEISIEHPDPSNDTRRISIVKNCHSLRHKHT